MTSTSGKGPRSESISGQFSEEVDMPKTVSNPAGIGSDGASTDTASATAASGAVPSAPSPHAPASSTVWVEGEVKFGTSPMEGVSVNLTDLHVVPKTTQTCVTGGNGCYKFDNVNRGHNVYVEFPSSVTFSGQKVVLHGRQQIYCCPSENLRLPDICYVSKGGQICGLVERRGAGSIDCTPLSGLTVTLRKCDNRDGAGTQTTTDSDGRFCLTTEQTGLMTVGFDEYRLEGEVLSPSVNAFDVFVTADCPTDVWLPTVIYSAGTGYLCGTVSDGKCGLKDVRIELLDADGKCLVNERKTDDNGSWVFANLPPGSYQVRYPDQILGKSLELPRERQTQCFDIHAGDVKMATPVAYQPEPHIIERQVWIGDQPADGILVDVRHAGARSALQSQRTANGLVSFVLDQGGTYEVRVYPDPQAFGDPLVDVVEVHSKTTGVTRLPAPQPSAAPTFGGRRAFGGGGMSASGLGGPVIDISPYPVLTEEVGYPPSPIARPAGMPGSSSAAPALGQTAMKAISDVLGWQVKPDPKAFLGALNASFSLTEVGGHTEASWTPRTYAVQTDLSGGVTGAQASVYTRAKGALDQSLPLLDGLYALSETAKPEDIDALRATVRSQFTDLVNELGLLGGPRISRVTQLFYLLLGQNNLPQQAPVPATFKLITDPDQISGSLGNLRQEFGFSIAADQVNTVEDEQDVTNFRIISDYLTSLAQSWLNNLQFFGLQTTTPFFGTQLVLLSRQLSVVAEKTNEVRFTLDSVFIGPADRQTLQIAFTPPDPPMFLEDLLTWIDGFASEEGPRLIAEGGKFAVGQSFVPIAQQLQRLVLGLLSAAQSSSLPPSFRTSRVQFSLQDLADSLQQLVSLATPLAHVITPEAEFGLSILGINPNVVSTNQTQAFITIIGTGFDVNNQRGLSVQGLGSALGSQMGILSDNLAFLTVNASQLAPANSPYAVTIQMANRNNPQQPATLVTALTVLQP
jgi:hypothetical protein